MGFDPSESPPRGGGIDPDTTRCLESGSLTPEPGTLSQHCTAFRHSGWQADRDRVYDAMVAVGTGASRLLRFAMCGAFAWVMRSADDPAVLRIAGNYCHDRHCIPCARAKAATVAGNLRAQVGDRPHRFITLTLRSTTDTLTEQVSRLYKCFAKLRRRSCWSDRIKGGAAFLELTYNHERGCWHPHLHVVADGAYLPQQELSSEWLQVTGDSYIVDVRLIRGKDQCLDYVTKYASKGFGHDVIAHRDALEAAIVALRGRRLCLTFGTWRGVCLTAQPPDGDWLPLAPLGEIIVRAHDGDQWAQAVLANLTGDTACRPHSVHDPPQPATVNHGT